MQKQNIKLSFFRAKLHELSAVDKDLIRSAKQYLLHAYAPYSVKKDRNPNISHAPKRKDILSKNEKKLAIRNALRYFPGFWRWYNIKLAKPNA